MNTLWRWSRLASAKWEDAWTERLRFLGPGNVAVVGWPGSRSIRLEAFCDASTARKLVREFGGRATKARDWTANPAQPRKPLRIRGRLTIHSDESTLPAASRPRHADIFIPAGMAFGTGDHATTASCLRMLCDISSELPSGWSAIDAGTGSGILAIAAAALGAGRVEAFDFDPACVRIAKANSKVNKARTVFIHQANVLEWTAGSKEHHLVMANLYSELLMTAASRLKQALRQDGHFVFSGVLRNQLPEVCAALKKQNFSILRTVIRGKWSAGHCRLR